ncbi:MAG: amidohydrolase family protein [bacterium]
MTCELILKANYILPILTPLIQDGGIHIKDGTIIECAKFSKISSGDKKIVELKNACLLPGFVNAHSHLELTSLKGKIPYKGSFIQWIQDIIEAKKGWNERNYINSLKLSIKQLIESGTTTIVDITASGLSPQILLTSNLRGRTYKEITGFKFDSVSQIITDLKKYLSNLSPTNLIDFGVSPHSPYSVSPKLLTELFSLSQNNNLPLSIHLAEDKTELKFLMKGKGEIINLLKELNVWEDEWKQPGLSSVKYLDSIGILNSNIIGVHLNCINEEDLEILKKRRVGVVHCPKSHKFFQRDDFPIQKLIDKGIIIALGTDSLASNDSLNMLEEIKELKRRYKTLSAEEILELATINGAKILGLMDKIGTLQPGKKADIIALRLPEDLTKEKLYEFIVTNAKKVILNMVDGNFLSFEV